MKKEFPSNPFLQFKILDKLMAKLDPQNSIIEYTIVNAINNKVPPRQIFATIASQHEDNPALITGIVGEELWAEIRDFQ